MNTTAFCLRLLNTNHFVISEIMIEDGRLGIALESTARKAKCPQCGKESDQLHSTYMRFPVDLAWAEWPVILHLKVKRFFCRNRQCLKRTFAERFPEFVAWYARRTERVLHRQQCLGVNVCARIAEKLLRSIHLGISDSTVNRMICKLPEVESKAIRILGVDDWAKRKGQRYGTILVDLERGRIVDLLGDRTAESLVKWLEGHPEIEIVSRDRSQTYAEAVDQGASTAIQVADRWHLLKNASDVLFKILQQEHANFQKLLNPPIPSAKLSNFQGIAVDSSADLTLSEQQRKGRMETVQQLHAQGWSQKRIARQIQVHPKTVHRYLRASSARARCSRKDRLLDAFKPYLLQRWNEGCHNGAQLCREIQAQGFAGHQTTVLDTVRQFRKASGLSPRIRNHSVAPLCTDPTRQPVSLRTLNYWLFRQPEQRKQEHEKLIEQIRAEQPKLDEVIAQARAFAVMVRQQKVDELDPWIQQTEASSYRVWKNFGAGIKQDRDAMQAALIYPWSNGPTEGHINRLKCLKRQMYGRAKDDLLRKRVLWQGRWGFT